MTRSPPWRCPLQPRWTTKNPWYASTISAHHQHLPQEPMEISYQPQLLAACIFSNVACCLTYEICYEMRVCWTAAIYNCCIRLSIQASTAELDKSELPTQASLTAQIDCTGGGCFSFTRMGTGGDCCSFPPLLQLTVAVVRVVKTLATLDVGTWVHRKEKQKEKQKQ